MCHVTCSGSRDKHSLTIEKPFVFLPIDVSSSIYMNSRMCVMGYSLIFKGGMLELLSDWQFDSYAHAWNPFP